MSKAIAGHDVSATDVANVSEIEHLLRQDKVPWYRKKNLRRLYLCLVPAALGVEMTSGYDGSVLNGLQAVEPWESCEFALRKCVDGAGTDAKKTLTIPTGLSSAS